MQMVWRSGAARRRLSCPLECGVVRCVCSLSSSTCLPESHNFSLGCHHLLYSDLFFTYLWNWFDGNYPPVKPTEEVVAGGKLKRRAAEIISFERLICLVGFR